MTDRELLKLAAKAANIEHGADRLDCGLSITLPGGRHHSLPRWNPLEDDGDAFRLAVKLRLAIDIGIYLTSIDGPREGQQEFVVEHHDGAVLDCNDEEACAATRRAIVRAAAEIGRQHD